MAQTVGTRQNTEAALQRHLEQLELATPQQQQLTVTALCQGVAAQDPAWVDVLVQVVSSAPKAIQQQLAAQPGLVKDLAGYLAHSHTSSSNTAGAAQQSPAAHPSVVRSDTTRSSSPSQCPPAGNNGEQQQQQKAGSSSHAAHTTPSSSSSKQLEAAAGALAHLLDCCEASVPPPPYQDLGPALHAALQQRLVCLPALAQATLVHHASHMVADQQLLGRVLDAAEQGEALAAGVLAILAPLMLHELERNPPAHTQVHDRVTALLARGTAAGAAFLAKTLLWSSTLLEAPSMVEAACSGLLAACRRAADAGATSGWEATRWQFPCLEALPPAHAVCLQYLWGVVDVVLHLAAAGGASLCSRLAGPTEGLVPPLAEALNLLLQSLQLPHACSWLNMRTYGHEQRPYHDAAWAALLALGECPQTAALVAALFQRQPALLTALAASWDRFLDMQGVEEPANHAARLATCLLLSGTIPGQEERRQHQQLLVAAVPLWGRVWPNFWRGHVDLLLEMIQLPHGPQAVVRAPKLLELIFCRGSLGLQHGPQCWARLLAAPGFASGLVEGVGEGDRACLDVVGCVWSENEPAYTQALLAMPGLGEALAQCCSKEGCYHAVDGLLGHALSSTAVQAYLEQQPVLQQALAARMGRKQEYASFLLAVLAAPRADEWLVQQPVLLDGVLAALMAGGGTFVTMRVVSRLLGAAPSLLCESLLRQPSIVEQLLRTLVRRYWQAPWATAASGGVELELLQKLASSGFAPRTLALLPGLMAKGDAVLWTGVFEAMHLIQNRMAPSSLSWGGELAAASSSGTAMLCAEGQLLVMHRGVEQVQRANAAAAATTQHLLEHLPAAGTQAAAGDHLPGRSQGGNKRLQRHQAGALQQPAPPGVVVASSREHQGVPGQQAAAAATSKRAAEGHQVPGRVPAPTAAGGALAAAAVWCAVVGAPPPLVYKRTRR